MLNSNVVESYVSSADETYRGVNQALLVMLMPLMAYLGLISVGLGSATAVAALLFYSLLPIVRNTHAGLHGISAEHHDAAAALGLPPAFRLFQIELPLASRSILAGIKTAAVLNVGFATLGALIGAGGYGQPILSGPWGTLSTFVT